MAYPYIVRNVDGDVEEWIEKAYRPIGGMLYSPNPRGFLQWALASKDESQFWNRLSIRPDTLDLDFAGSLLRRFKRQGVRAIYASDLITMINHGVQSVHVYSWLAGNTTRQPDVWALLCLANLLYQFELHEQFGPRHPLTGVLDEPESWTYTQWWADNGVGPRYIEVDGELEPTSYIPVSWRKNGRWGCGFVSEEENLCWRVIFYAP